MNTRIRMTAVVVGVLAAMAIASSAHAANNCGNVPPRDGTGQQLGRRMGVRSTLATVKLVWRYALPIQLTGAGWGPGDGTGFGGDGPLDGTGYGPGGGEGIGLCDGTGPNGTITRRGR